MLYSVWVGGVELDHYFTKRTDAEDIAEVHHGLHKALQGPRRS